MNLVDKIKTHVGRISRTTDCAESWNLAKNWIEECNNSHDACHESLSEWRLPTRLIDVDARHCDNGCRLVLTDQLESSTSYLTLSHCWGGKVHLKLTTMNQSEFLGMTGIPFEKLSKTFQQAIYTTRKLGYRYIWIDSLCIFQDDADDWNREAAVMGQIYANSELNLAASDSPDGNTGLFFDRSERRATGWKVMCLVDANSLNTEAWDCTPRYWASDITTNVLNTRGWVFQERFLVRRTLSFGSHELVWECRAKDASETFPESIKHGLETLNAIAHRFLGKKSIIPINNPVNISIGWGDVVNGYSSQALSFPNDKLVAISGVAKLFAEKYGQRYLAGMWDKDLIRQLNWSSASPGTDLRHLGRAPSWSWASTDNLVSLPRTLFGSGWHQNVVIEDIAMVPTDDPFTVCKGGSLRVRCQTLPHGIMMPYDGAPALKLAMCIYNTRIPGSGVWPDYLEEYCASQEVFYLPLLMLPPGGTETPAIFGLVLQKVSAGIYSRVGSFRVFSQEAIEGMNRVLVANEGEQAENFKDGAREESWNGPCFTIQIV